MTIRSRAGFILGICAATLTLAGCASTKYGAPSAKVAIESNPPDAELWIIPHDAWIEHTRNHEVTQSDPWLQTFRKGRTNKDLTLPMTEQYALTFDKNGRPVMQLFRPGTDSLVTLDLK